MKNFAQIALRSCLASCAIFIFAASKAFSHDGHEHASTQASDAQQSQGSLLELMRAGFQDLSKAISNKKLSEVHSYCESVANTSHKLSETIARGPDYERTNGLLNNLTKALDSLHDSADRGEQTQSEANLKKVEILLQLVFQKFKQRW